MRWLSQWFNTRSSTAVRERRQDRMAEVHVSYRQFREQFPLARIIFEEPIFLSIASGVRFLPKVDSALQAHLVRSHYEEALQAAWIANLNGEAVVIAYHLKEARWQVVTLEVLKRGGYDEAHLGYFKPYEISLELKRLIVYHHQLLMEIGINMAKNSAKTILSIKSEQNGYNVQEAKARKALSAELASYTSDKVLLTSNGQWSTVAVDTAPLLEIRRNILQSIACITSIPMEILEQSNTSQLFSTESDSARRYKAYVRSLQQRYLYPIYSLTLAHQSKWQLLDPFGMSERETLELAKAREEVRQLRIANALTCQSHQLDLEAEEL